VANIFGIALQSPRGEGLKLSAGDDLAIPPWLPARTDEVIE